MNKSRTTSFSSSFIFIYFMVLLLLCVTNDDDNPNVKREKRENKRNILAYNFGIIEVEIDLVELLARINGQ